MTELKITAANFETRYCVPTNPFCWISMRTMQNALSHTT